MSRAVFIGAVFTVCALSVVTTAPAVAADRGAVNYNRDVRPILSNNCFLCHGRDAGRREAGLRLDQAEFAYAEADSGLRAIVPGNLEESELIVRISEQDPSLRMPPEDSHKTLTDDEIDILKRWVAEGAEYQGHWSFLPPERPEPPKTSDAYRVANAIDQFVVRGLVSEGLPQAERADRRTMIRRLSLDLTGLPPTLEQIDAFISDSRTDAYERLVDRLLSSPHYGERMALSWLDAARYADTHGYHIDSHRDMWPWRDWVIDAFNDNMPFDQFSIWQLAGDLLPEATTEQQLASGFHRNHGINFEGGAIPEEYRVEYVVDRVNTTGSVWLGLTVGCARCHDHKYDPISQEEYFRLFAFYNTIDEKGLDGQRGNATPMLKLPTREQAREQERLQHIQKELTERIKNLESSFATAQRQWEASHAEGTRTAVISPSTWHKVPVVVEETAAEAIAEVHLDPTAADLRKKIEINNVVRNWRRDPGLIDGNVHKFGSERGSHYLCRELQSEEPTTAKLSVGCTDALRIWLNGELIFARDEELPVPREQHEVELELSAGKNTLLAKIVNISWGCEFYCSLRSPDGVALAPEVAKLVEKPSAQRTEAESKTLQAYFTFHAPANSEYRDALRAKLHAERQLALLDQQIVTTMVMREAADPRKTFRLDRGQYDSPREEIEPTTPAALPPLPEDAPLNRLTLAEWLMASDHPLTARVTVNRLWQMMFGVGIVATSEDFGAQGQWPSHPELLDWLAVELVDSGWDVQHILRLIAHSETYRQESHATPDKLARDRENRLLSRGPRQRLPAELIRDLALAVSDLLNPTVGGPSVKPYQPPGLWGELAHQKDNSKFTAQVFQQDEGDALYRRGMYTFWKRSVPPPNMVAFDAPNREVCTVRRETTNTPIQALVLLNDPVFVEAARALAERMLVEGGSVQTDRLAYGFELATSRNPTPEELGVLTSELERQRSTFGQDPAAAERLLSVGHSSRNGKIDAVEHAAWTNVASILLNLDETITKE